MAWFDELNLPGATVTGFFAFVHEDGPDEDDFPDLRAASGTVKFTPTTSAVRVDGGWVGVSPVTATIFEGEIVSGEEDSHPIRLLSTDADVGVDDWAWRATFNIDGARIAPVEFYAPVEGVNITGGLIPVTGAPVEVVTGPPGAGLAIRGQVGSVDDLPTTVPVGTGYLIDGDVYVLGEDGWFNAGPFRGEKGDRGATGIVSITSPEPGVWLVDQVTETDASGLEDLQEALYGKADRTELSDAVDGLSERIDSADTDLDSAALRLDEVEAGLAPALSRLGTAPVAVTFVNNSSASIPNREAVTPDGWTQVGSGTSAIQPVEGGFQTAAPGLYLLSLSGSYGSGTPSGNYEYRLLKNGERILAFYGSSDTSSRSGACAAQIDEGDVISVEYYQSSGSEFLLRPNSFNAITFTRIA